MGDQTNVLPERDLNLSEALSPTLLAQKLMAAREQERRSREAVFGDGEVPSAVRELTPEKAIDVAKGTDAPLATPPAFTISNELRGLFVQYCATMIQAIQLSEVDWGPLAQRLGTRAPHLQKAAELANHDETLWSDVMTERIRRVGAARTFRDVKWETIESKSLNMLMILLENNLIRDPGELMAIAAQARKVNVHEAGSGHGNQNSQNNFTINIGGDKMGQDGLPSAGTKMTIDLSPRIAASLANRTSVTDKSDRVIDSEMLDAKELRTVLEERHLRTVNPKGEVDE
ncbi:hypothetical protein Bpfe_031130 [Biomphalaria pfeifferi]|uniref:Uncharacterized protein n=1 Tax=Biomphalaria pfeifferi TaxID=112525 RepID=A0AAD8EU53_BIOPF|nr:hypothetical protein Bpfe_031130 [Biomphalaria pfeifferi]